MGRVFSFPVAQEPAEWRPHQSGDQRDLRADQRRQHQSRDAAEGGLPGVAEGPVGGDTGGGLVDGMPCASERRVVLP